MSRADPRSPRPKAVYLGHVFLSPSNNSTDGKRLDWDAWLVDADFARRHA